MTRVTLGKVAALRDDLNKNLLERQVPVDIGLLGLLTASHVLMLGPPGCAKSLLVRSICERIAGATYFERLLTRFSTPEEIFGPLSLSALEHDEYRRVPNGCLQTATLAFIDECYKSNSALLNALLSVMAERVFHEQGVAHPIPLVSLFGASNECPEDSSLTALHDRFLLRVVVSPLVDDQSLRRLFELQPAAPTATITLDDLREAQQQVAQLPLTDEAREAIIAIKHGLEEEGIAASDRRWKATALLVKAKAWLDGEAQVTSDSCDVLVHAVWSEPSQIRVVERVVSKIANPLNLEAVELEDAAKDLYDQRPQPDHPQLTQALEPLLRQLSDIHTRLEQRIASVPEKRSFRARQALNKVETYHRALSQLALKSLSKLHMAPGAA